jgi:uncharacterized protein YigE (DUF2233 family)
MRRFLSFVGLLALFCWSVSHFRARGDVPWKQLGNGLESRTFTWHGVQVHAFRAHPSKIEVGTGALLDAPDWLRKERARVVINGGYFDEHSKPLGLRVSKSTKTSRLRQADWGVFWIRKGRARIAHTRDYPSKIRPTEAIQCGPRLVVAGKTTDLKPQWGRRTGVGIDRSGRVVLAITDGQLLLSNWAQVFASNDGLGCRDALNMDGGGSTQMAYSTARAKGRVNGSWPVPDVIVIR